MKDFVGIPAGSVATHATDALAEADRLMTVCNSCRYCEGLCAVFPAMEMRRAFHDGDLDYLANLCHACGACYIDCQFSPPHEFNVNVPRTLAVVRAQSYGRYAWPRALAPLFDRNGLAISLIAAACVALFVAGFVGWRDPGVLFGTHTAPGAFYRLMPHNTIVALFGSVFAFAILAIGMSLRAFWRDTGARQDPPRVVDVQQASIDVATLKYLDGGGVGCYAGAEPRPDHRRVYHHLTFYGFLFCFASTSTATIYHYVFGWIAPYPWYDLPVVLGSLGGLGLIAGPLGLLQARAHRDREVMDPEHLGMDVAFLVMLLLTSVTGFLLLLLRSTPAMGLLLAVHLGVVFALFLTLPYGKFMHGLYRALALLRYAKEARSSLA